MNRDAPSSGLGDADLFGAGAPAESSFQIADLLQVLERRWRLIVGVVLLCLLGAGLRYAITPREYRAETQIQIERRSLSSLASSAQSNSNAWLESWWNMEYYPTQYRLLQSRGLAERVVKNLRLAENAELAAQSSTRASAGHVTAAEDEAQLGALASGLLGGLEVTPIANTQLVVIAYRSRDARMAAAVANGFAEAFIDWGIESRSETVGKASGFLTQQIEEVKAAIAKTEQSLQSVSRSSNLVSGENERVTSVTLERMSAMNESYSAAQNERISREARYNEVMRTAPSAIADGQPSERFGQLKNDLAALEREYDSKLKTFKPEFPAMVELKAKIERQRQSVESARNELVAQARERARADYQEALHKEQRLAGEISALKEQNLRENSASVEYANLAAELANKRNLLNDLLAKQSEAAVTSRLQETRESNVRVVDRALVPQTPFRPSLRRDLTVGLVLGLMVGLGLVFLLEFLDRSLKEPEEVEKLLGLPTLAVIPDISERAGSYRAGYGYGYGPRQVARRGKGGERRQGEEEELPIELLPHLRPRLAVAEAYRSLRTALLLASAQELKVVSLTSAESGEGKTTTATNLAVVLAQLGRQVLLIDGDLRRPRLHEILRASNRTGLVNLLTSAPGRAEEVFLRTQVPNLYLLPSGPIPPNPAELLASDRMRDFVQHVRSHFDFVVIDSPPTLAVTDATLIGSLADGVLLCLRAGRVTREDARSCRDRLARAEVKILGTVLNGHSTGQGRYARHYYKYAPSTAEAAADDAREPAA
ncbi:MAG TPA: polysaccharide biosynthesis tyrosine autokinase [Thermoanaerobaculia bacterium]|nr:polysaccharide biosynthesis tyrosine autokinase [Thermoanaerobaculia bacterium]